MTSNGTDTGPRAIICESKYTVDWKLLEAQITHCGINKECFNSEETNSVLVANVLAGRGIGYVKCPGRDGCYLQKHWNENGAYPSDSVMLVGHHFDSNPLKGYHLRCVSMYVKDPTPR